MATDQARSKDFLEWLEKWEEGLPSLELSEAVTDPAQAAIISEDLLKGFCDVGPLSSDRAAGIVPAAVDLFKRAYDLGVRHFLLFQDTHDPESVEFSAYPPHCVEGTEESETIDEMATLPFSNLFTVLPKNSISSDVGTDLELWLEEHREVNTFIVVGVCTDICVYEAAIHLRVRANVQGRDDVRVIVPANAVQTYDMPVEFAEEIGALPHDGDLLHRIFLYQMALNDIEVPAALT